MQYSRVTDEIYLGTNFCCEMHASSRFIEGEGIRASISLETEILVTEPARLKYFLWLPTIDHTAPTLESLALGVQMLQFLVQRHIKVYVHCQNGHGRAPTLVAAYFIASGQSVKQAMKTVARKRPEIHIEPVQEARLEEFASRLSWK